MFHRHQSTRRTPLALLLSGLWRSRSELGWAVDVLRYGLCGDCPLGTHGLRDELLRGSTVCSARMEGLHRWTAGPLDLAQLEDASALSGLSEAELRGLGRLAEPVLWRAGQPGFVPVDWDDAVKLVCSRLEQARGRWTLGFNPSELSNEAMFCLSELAQSATASWVFSPLSPAQELGLRVLQDLFSTPCATATLEELLGADLVFSVGLDALGGQLVSNYLAKVVRDGGRVVELLQEGDHEPAVTEGLGRVVYLVGPGIVGPAARSALVSARAACAGGGMIPVGWPPGYRAAYDLGLAPETTGEPPSAVDVCFQAGSVLETSPSAAFRVHQVFDLDPAVLLPADEAVLLLPMQSRFEMSGGGTYTSLVGRVRFSPEIRGHQIGSSCPDWWVASQLLSRLEGGDCAYEDGDAVRRSLAQLRPDYARTAELFEAGERFDVPSEARV